MLSNNQSVLVVDLDGTLLRSDMLMESFWSASAEDWKVPFLSILALLTGRSALKNYLANLSDVDVTTLPYDLEVIDYVKAHRRASGRTVLVTASNQTLARNISDHLNIFDEVHGSDQSLNLKGEIKAAFLTQSFGENGFEYMGDSEADLHVWKHAKKVITVNAGQSVKLRAEALGKPFEHLGTVNRSVQSYTDAIRVHHWLKNLLLFMPMLLGHQLTWEALSLSFMAFVAFSLVASSVYVLNDLLDLRADRAHPRKSMRAFASGKIPIAHGGIIIIGLLFLGMFLGKLIGSSFLLILIIYFILNIGYSFDLKRRIIVDISVLSCFFTLRIFAGGIATGIMPTVWLLAFSIFFFFSLAAVKRQGELVDLSKRNQLKAMGRGYHIKDVSILSMAALASGYVSVLVMALYINSPIVVKLYSTPNALWGICGILLYWKTRIVMVTYRGSMHDDPILYIVKDRVSQICFIVMATLIVFAATW